MWNNTFYTAHQSILGPIDPDHSKLVSTERAMSSLFFNIVYYKFIMLKFFFVITTIRIFGYSCLIDTDNLFNNRKRIRADFE